MKHLIKILTVEELSIFETAAVSHRLVALTVLKNTLMKLVVNEDAGVSLIEVITSTLIYTKKTKNYDNN